MSMASTVWELVWLIQLLCDLQVTHKLAALLICDNKAALHITTNLMFHERTKYIEIGCHLIKDKKAWFED